MTTIYHNESFDDNDEVSSSKLGGVCQSREAIRKNVVLLGSGDMSMGLAINLLRAQINPVVASRNPDRARARLKKMGNLDVDVLSIEEGVAMGEIIVVAIPAEHHSTLTASLLKGKIVIDISNRSPSDSSDGKSIAEKLQELLPDSHVVKAFNTISSYALCQGNIQGSKEVPICGDSERARNQVSALVRDIGLIPIDQGSLKNSKAVEDIPLSFFPQWRVGFVLALCLFIFYFILELFNEQLCPNIDAKNETTWDLQLFNTLPLMNVQVSLAGTAATLLLVTYIPGCLAAYIQLYRGTKYSPFPDWLDNWMKSRKQFGLLALLLGGLHGCSAIFSKMAWGLSYPEVWTEQLYLMLGPALLASLIVLGVTSLPSVSSRLTWREFSVVQRAIGWTCIVLLFLHDGFIDWERLFSPLSCVIVPSVGQITLVLCMITLSLKIPLLMPCIDSYLTKIRNGYERGTLESSPA